ncbi:transcriptional regulator NrdR, partial [archaeon CG_4_10_14_0_2_um_filter_Archaea_38_6]
MKCPYCSSSKTKVIDKRATNDNSNWRRRECTDCNRRFTTYENVEPITLMVVKKKGGKQVFDKNKIVESVIKSRSKKNLPMERIESIVDDIEREILARNCEEIKSNEIGELVLKHLKPVDPVAYIRFASVFRQFDDISTFENEIK